MLAYWDGLDWSGLLCRYLPGYVTVLDMASNLGSLYPTSTRLVMGRFNLWTDKFRSVKFGFCGLIGALRVVFSQGMTWLGGISYLLSVTRCSHWSMKAHDVRHTPRSHCILV